ncbi:MAG: alpha/beta fold hydrolase [Candidatus Paceibacterota bacterium]
MPRLTRFIIYGAIFVAGFVLISLFNFYLVTHPQKIELAITPEGLSLPQEEVILEAEDGTSISGWHIPSPEAPEQALLLLHGYPAEKEDMLFLARDLYPDFSLLLIDFRYFGESDGNASTLGVKERQDVRAAIDFLSERYEYIGVFGYSYGGAIALMHAAEDTRVDAIASYGAFSDLRTLGYETYRNLWILKYPMIELMNLWMRVFHGAWASSVSPTHSAKSISKPVFIGHTEGDPFVPVGHAHRILHALTESGNQPQTYIADGSSHIGLPRDLDEHLLEFFKGNI